MREGPDVAKSLPCWLSPLSFSKLRQLTGHRPRNVRTKEREQHFSFISKAEFFLLLFSTDVSASCMAKIVINLWEG